MRKPYTLTVDERGDVLVAGPDPNDPSLLFVAKLDTHGTVLWRRWVDQAEPRVTPVPDSQRLSFEPEGDDDLRDSFEPLLLDGDRPALAPRPSRWRRLGTTVAAACVLSASLAGAAMARGDIATSSPMAHAAMSFEVQPAPAPLQTPRPIAASEVIPAPAWTATFDDLGLDPDASADELRGATLMLLQLGEPGQAHHVAQRLLQTSPGGAYGYLLAGAALQELGEIADARRVYRMCVELAERDQPGQLRHLSECRALAAR